MQIIEIPRCFAAFKATSVFQEALEEIDVICSRRRSLFRTCSIALGHPSE